MITTCCMCGDCFVYCYFVIRFVVDIPHSNTHTHTNTMYIDGVTNATNLII